MSLLIKALQKAEQGKRAEDKAGAGGSDLTLELAPLQANTNLGEMTSEQAQASADNKRVSQQTAAAMFKAKDGSRTRSAPRRIWLIAGFGLLLVMVLGIGFYSYLQSLQQPVAPLAYKPAAAGAKLQAEPATALPLAEQVAQAPVAEAASAVEEPRVAPAGMRDSKPEAQAMPVDASEPRKVQTAEPISFGEPIAEESPVKITTKAPEARINPTVLAAYQAFMAGNDNKAQDLYWQALRSDPLNVDALLGMAAVALREGRSNDAAGWYGKVLETEPRNAVAQAAMISLLDSADAVAHESRIKNLLAQKPEAAYLHAALGNLYAAQGQWPAAQQAYFDAYHFDSDNAEYAFNLAVSLDHMGKSSLALQYYKQAQTLLAGSAITKIDREQLAVRIAQLQ